MTLHLMLAHRQIDTRILDHSAKLLVLDKIVKPDDASDALAIAISHARMSCILR